MKHHICSSYCVADAYISVCLPLNQLPVTAWTPIITLGCCLLAWIDVCLDSSFLSKLQSKCLAVAEEHEAAAPSSLPSTLCWLKQTRRKTPGRLLCRSVPLPNSQLKPGMFPGYRGHRARALPLTGVFGVRGSGV